MNVFANLFQSRKAVVMLLVIAASFVALYLGKATWEQVESMIKWLVTSWMVVLGGEKSVQKLADAKVNAARASVPPPPSADVEVDQ